MRLTSDNWGKEGKEGIDFDKFIVCGRLYNSNKRFSHTYPSGYAAYSQAMSVNLWNGSVWGIRSDNGRRKLIKRVKN